MVKAILRKANSGNAVVTSAPAESTTSNPEAFAQELLGKKANVIDVEAHTVETPVEGVNVVCHTTSDNTTSSPSTAVVITHNASPARYEEESDGGIEGDFDSGDVKLPQLKIVNGSGPLSQQYGRGTLLYADEVLFEAPTWRPGETRPSLRFVPIKITKQYREKLTPEEMDQDLMPRVVNSREEAIRLGKPDDWEGGITEWIDKSPPRWQASARCLFLLEEPFESQHPGFTSIADGRNYAACVYYAGGMAYGQSAKQIFNTANLSLRSAVDKKIYLPKRFWTWSVISKAAGKFAVAVPSIKLTKEETGPELRELARLVAGSRSVEVVED